MHKSKKRAFATQGMIFTANNEARSKTTQIHCLRTRAFFSCLWMIRKVRIQWIFCAILTYWLVVLTIRVYHIYIYICILIVIFRVYVYLPEGNPIYVYIYIYWLVVSIPLTNMSSSMERIIPCIMENKNCLKPPTSLPICAEVHLST